jgi:LysM repeat protein
MQRLTIPHVCVYEVIKVKKIKHFTKLALSTMLMVSLLFFCAGYGSANSHSITIKKGDTLYSISRQYNLSVQELKDYNLLTTNTIYAGQKLLIPSINHTQPLYAVVGGSYLLKENADKQGAALKKIGIDAVTVKKVINDKNYYRIQAGVFTNKVNAEKQKQTLQKNGIKDAYVLTEKHLHINGITVGSTYNHLMQQFGQPARTEDYLNVRSLYYQNQGAGVRVNFNMENGSVFGLQVYPEFLKMTSVPKEKSKILNVYGYPNEVKKVTCYESASCEQFIYLLNKNKLTVQFDRDNKTVQYLDLSKLP